MSTETIQSGFTTDEFVDVLNTTNKSIVNIHTVFDNRLYEEVLSYKFKALYKKQLNGKVLTFMAKNQIDFLAKEMKSGKESVLLPFMFTLSKKDEIKAKNKARRANPTTDEEREQKRIKVKSESQKRSRSDFKEISQLTQQIDERLKAILYANNN
jgi:hypothetical protein